MNQKINYLINIMKKYRIIIVSSFITLFLLFSFRNIEQKILLIELINYEILEEDIYTKNI